MHASIPSCLGFYTEKKSEWQLLNIQWVFSSQSAEDPAAQEMKQPSRVEEYSLQFLPAFFVASSQIEWTLDKGLR